MCGIVGAIGQRDVVQILVEGLKRLEYRGYDSAGIAVLNKKNKIERIRRIGKVKELEEELTTNVHGNIGIAHTRWATHGKPTEANAHPHTCNNKVTLVHNGIIENHEELRDSQKEKGYKFTSETDTEVIVHQVCDYLGQGKDLFAAVQAAVSDLEGAYSLGVISPSEPDTLIAARKGSPLLIGVGVGEYFIASDKAALIPVTQQFIVLNDGDMVKITRDKLEILDENGKSVEREIHTSELNAESVERGKYKHFMLKEIYSQPSAISDCLEGRISSNKVLEECFGPAASEVFDNVQGIEIIACGTSYHAGLVSKYWFESIAGIPCSVEVASEFRYRKPVVRNNSLIITLSQSGETADTLAALQEAKKLGYGHSLAICNSPESSIVRESDLVLMTRAGPEISVASTKAFTTQLVCLMLVVLTVGRRHGLSEKEEARIVKELASLPRKAEEALDLNEKIMKLAENFTDKNNALFLGRGAIYPVAMEGALKLKEISYIHAEAYPAGELKHGPLALV
ncbi:MAG: glutamine--fructose-6-phosphate transaminase (isomerizing), partial [Gammaproteobacteria bacterium]|nr:glutamine--fructose-6-phosphate transaminase (isomerizing) [Gammaproteobacteria bacterium]